MPAGRQHVMKTVELCPRLFGVGEHRFELTFPPGVGHDRFRRFPVFRAVRDFVGFTGAVLRAAGLAGAVRVRTPRISSSVINTSLI